MDSRGFIAGFKGMFGVTLKSDVFYNTVHLKRKCVCVCL